MDVTIHMVMVSSKLRLHLTCWHPTVVTTTPAQAMMVGVTKHGRVAEAIHHLGNLALTDRRAEKRDTGDRSVGIVRHLRSLRIRDRSAMG